MDQDTIVGCLIAVAIIYLARLLWFRLTKRANACCSTCSGCPSISDEEEEQVDLHSLTSSAPARSESEK